MTKFFQRRRELVFSNRFRSSYMDWERLMLTARIAVLSQLGSSEVSCQMPERLAAAGSAWSSTKSRCSSSSIGGARSMVRPRGALSMVPLSVYQYSPERGKLRIPAAR